MTTSGDILDIKQNDQYGGHTSQPDTYKTVKTMAYDDDRACTNFNALDQKTEPEFGFLSWDDGFFQFPGCDAMGQEPKRLSKTDKTGVEAKQSIVQEGRPKNIPDNLENKVKYPSAT
jgi:hypothetical protein